MLALVAVGVAASANASTIYNFSFMDGSVAVAGGSFTTDGAAADPGYELIASFTFDFLTAIDGTVFSGPFTAPPASLQATQAMYRKPYVRLARL